ncbi:hypothetical protein J22TS1_14320 [Siminovitchia terrae]|nr:hypothetical protein J22TS1_14320 [Siminovitchia terrae]
MVSPVRTYRISESGEFLQKVNRVCFIKQYGFIEEMRCATNRSYPVIAVLENVIGAFSSNNWLDFKAVLESF